MFSLLKMSHVRRRNFGVHRKYWLPHLPSARWWECSVWLSQLEHLENEYIVARTHIVGHNVCDNVVALPDVLEIPGVEALPAFANHSVMLQNVMLQNGVWYIGLQLFLVIYHSIFHSVSHSGN